MDIFLNELSIATPTKLKYEAKHKLDNLAILIKNFPAKVDSIRTPENFASIDIGPDYRFINWLSEFDEKTQDLKTLILTKIGFAPYSEEILYLNNIDKNQLTEFICQGDPCIGLGLASPIMFNTLSVSLDDSKWSEEFLEVDAFLLNEEVEENLLVNVRHSSRQNHLVLHTSWLKDRERPFVRSGKELWIKRNIVFPELIFCEIVSSQIKNLNQGNIEFRQIIDRLTELNQFCENWPVNSAFDPSQFLSYVTPESATRLKDFKKELTITRPDGIVELFSWHARYTPGAGRIHFTYDTSSRKLIIGSIANQNTIK